MCKQYVNMVHHTAISRKPLLWMVSTFKKPKLGVVNYFAQPVQFFQNIYGHQCDTWITSVYKSVFQIYQWPVTNMPSFYWDVAFPSIVLFMATGFFPPSPKASIDCIQWIVLLCTGHLLLCWVGWGLTKLPWHVWVLKKSLTAPPVVLTDYSSNPKQESRRSKTRERSTWGRVEFDAYYVASSAKFLTGQIH